MLEPLILRVHGHAGVAHHGLGPGGGYHQVARPVGEGIADVPEVAGLVLVLHLRVGEGGDAVGAPVDNAASLVNKALIVELAEGLPDGLGKPLVHGEAGPGPVAGHAHLLLLLDNAVSVLFLPLPDPLEELLPAQVIAAQALVDPEVLFHLHLGGDAGVVHAGDPEGGIALHPLEAGKDILEGAVQGVAHVELARDVGGRHDDGEGLFRGVRVAVEAPGVFPHLIDAALHLLGFVHFRQFFFHVGFSYSVNLYSYLIYAIGFPVFSVMKLRNSSAVPPLREALS